jgi:DNA polymerase elongation subunit (family B)
MEKYYRKELSYKKDDIEIQTLEWLDFNEQDDEDDEDNEDFNEPIKNEKYVIKTFGVTETGESVCLTIKNFTPFFYIKVPNNWNKSKVKIFLTNLCEVNGYFGASTRAYNPLYKWSKYLLKDKCILQRKKEFWGYQTDECNFLRLTFNNSEALRKFKYVFKSHNEIGNKTRIKDIKFNIKLYEDNLDPILRFLHIRDIKPCGWLTAKNIKVVSIKESRAQIELICNWQDISYYDKHTNGRILQASFDIEVFSFDDSFPVATVKQNVVTQIATTFKYTGDSDFTMIHIVCLKNCDPIEPTEGVETFLECYDTEKEVLLAWKRLIINMDPDILYTYNGDTFDCNYLCIRSKIADCEEEFLNISKLKYLSGKLNDATFGSSAHGLAEYKRFSIPGRINFDLLIFIFREYKDNNSYKLDDIAFKYLKQNKHPVTVTEIFDFFASGDPKKIKIIADYCIMDAKLPQRLVDRLHILQANLSMSNVTSVPFKMLIERGQQIKIFSQILKTTRKLNFVVPSFFGEIKAEDSDKLEGATVLPPKQGAYNKPVVVMDYKSLYPTIMIAHNLCYSTAWLSDKPPPPELEDSMQTFEWEEKTLDPTTKLEIIKQRSYTYVKPEKYQGVLPQILTQLAESRKYAKGKMAEAAKNGDMDLKEIYNKLQLAYKVSMNSIYGFLAAQTLTLKQIAGTVTAIGRQMIAQTKEFVEREYPKSECVYGDSVTGDTPILLRDPKTNRIIIETIENINNVNDWVEYPGFKINDTESIRNEKMYTTSNLEVWSNNGWNPIKKLIKHKTNKKIYRVLTHTGCVDVTEDHSLLSENGEKLKPKDVKVGDSLMHSFPENLNKELDNYIPISKNSNDKAIMMEKYYYLRMKGSNVKVTINTESNKIEVIETLMQNYNPTEIQSITLLKDTSDKDFVYDIETELGTFHAGVGQLIVKNTDSCFFYFETQSSLDFLKHSDRINSHTVITEKDEEYLEKLKVKCIRDAIDIGTKAAIEATKLFKEPIELEYEKVYWRMLMLTKKRYCGYLYSFNPEKPDYFDSKGIVLNRRDNFALMKKTYKDIMNILMERWDRGMPEIEKIITTTIDSIITNSIDIDDIIMTKAYKPPYKNENLPQVVVANKIKERDPGNAPRSNDRMNFVFIDTGILKKQALYTKVEEPNYAKEHNLPLDVEYYIEYMSKPISEILVLFMKNPEQLFRDRLNLYKRKRFLRIEKENSKK